MSWCRSEYVHLTVYYLNPEFNEKRARTFTTVWHVEHGREEEICTRRRHNA